MSPELVKNEPYDAKSDIWSLGCVLYELCTFQRPFVGDGVYDIFSSVVNDETPSITHLYSRDLNKILKKFVSKVAFLLLFCTKNLYIYPRTYLYLTRLLTKKPKERPSAGELLCEPFISNYVKVNNTFLIIKKTISFFLFFNNEYYVQDKTYKSL
jgi:serine/threonine protein kinase